MHLRDEELRPPPVWRAVADVAERQWGVVSLAQLAACGVARGAVEKAVHAGRLHPLHRGVYAVGHRRLGREGRYMAAVLACGRGALLSYRSAAAWWELLRAGPAAVDVTSPHGRHAIPGVRRHQARSLIARDTTTHRGIPITSVPRTLLDLAAVVRPDRLERALAQAERMQLYDHAGVTDVIGRTIGHGGGRALAHATAREPKLTRSELEVQFLGLTRQAGLPEPCVNPVLDALDHGPCEVDFYWPSHRLVVETDGFDTHGTRAAFEADRRRDAALTAAGYTVLRFTWREIEARPQTVLERLKAL
jgi:hypothetical protein